MLAPLLNAVGVGALKNRLDVTGGSEAELRQCVTHLHQKYGTANTSAELVAEFDGIRRLTQRKCESLLAALKTGLATLL